MESADERAVVSLSKGRLKVTLSLKLAEDSGFQTLPVSQKDLAKHFIDHNL